MNRAMVGSDLVAREAIRDLLARYTWAGDRGRSSSLAECFHADGVLDVGDHGGTWSGRDQIRTELEAVAERVAAAGPLPGPVHHHVSSIKIDLLDSRTADVHSYFCVFTAEGPDHWGSYRDHVAIDNHDGGWRFTSRSVRVLGRATTSRFLPEP